MTGNTKTGYFIFEAFEYFLTDFERYAVTALVFGVLGWWMGQPRAKPEPVTLVEHVTVHDTLYIASKPDTVFREKIIYRDKLVILTTQTRLPENKSEKGVSMKEKEELDNLLVSGAR
ncbi:MAG: hypothetical protein KF775_11330 [Cyclobacteriaceae bacterium]|nr:hypothetical protein [Cyclobacteriaceae bacterium]